MLLHVGGRGLPCREILSRKTAIFVRFPVFFMLFLCLHVAAEGFAQKVTLSMRQAPLSRVFDEISRQSRVSIAYNEELMKRANPVTIAVKDMPAEQAISVALKGQPFRLEAEGKIIYIRQAAGVPAPESPGRGSDVRGNIIVKGIVKNEKGEVLAGASIQVKGTDHTVVTDGKGEFEIRQVPENATLIVSSVGMQVMEVAVKGRTQISVVMKIKASALDEQVVTAFGVEKSSRELGYSTATVKGEELTKGNTGNILSGLSGRVSGLNIATQSTDMTPQMQVLMRGIRSFSSTSNNQPLFIMNGSPLSFGSDQSSAQLILDFINNINPNDVDKVTILKGANATALYGPEGVNGVIIITTRKGMKGRPVINFRNSVSFQRIDYRAVRYEQHEFGSGTGLVDANGNGIYSGTINNGWGPKYDGSKVQLGRTDEKGNQQMVDYSHRWDYRRFFDVARTAQSNLSISQGDENANFYLGLAYNDQKGILPGDTRNTLTAFLSGGRKMGIFNAQYQVNFFRELANLGPENYGPIGPTFIPFLSYKDYRNYEWADNNHYWADFDVMSPYQAIASDRAFKTQNSGIVSLNLTARPLPWLTIADAPGFVVNNNYQKHETQPVYFSDWAKQNGGFLRAFDRQATLEEENTTISTVHNHFTVMAVNKAGNFDFRNLVGNVVDEQRYKQVGGNSNALAIPVYNLVYSTDVASASERYVLTRRYSFFATSTMAYRQRAFLELTARNDWDSKRAAVGRGKDLYVGGSLSVLMREAVPALQRLSWLSFLQLKGAVTTTANMNILPYQSERTLQSTVGFPFNNGSFGGTGLASYSYLPGNPNPYLKPEKVLSVESGFTARFFKDLLAVNFAYYWQRNNGVITAASTGWLSGAPTIDNLGVMNNWGYEVDIDLNNVVKNANGFNLSGGFRIAMNKNVVKWLAPDYGGVYVVSPPGGRDGLAGTVARKGHQAFEYWLYDYKKDAQGRTIVDPVTGYPIPDLNTAVYEGTTTPKYVGSFNLLFSYRRWTLSTLSEFNIGGNHYFSRGEGLTRAGLHEQTTYNDRLPFVFPNSVYLDANGKSVVNTSIKTQAANSFLYSNVSQASANFLSNSDFLRLKEVVLGYEQVFKTGSIRKLNLGIYGRNLFNWYSRSNLYGDPQLIKGPGRFTAGISQAGGGTAGNSGNVAPQAGSSQYTPPGVVEYGVILSANF
ncbi:MAG TPA: SusC/RagA family TonB-linked outer membrane protein [Puia sp.]|nr:SusC/RagA family TonB-linked outer membrane protein [Puia sp.]